MTHSDDRSRRTGTRGTRGRPGPARTAEGTSRRARRRTLRRALRREVPSTVGLLADHEDFAAMRAYPSFGFDDHPHYQRRMQGLLRSLDAEGIHVSVVLFDPAEYAEYCAATGRDPDTQQGRAEYTARAAANGITIRYQGQPLDDLVTQLLVETDRHTTWEQATDILADATDDPNAAFDRASNALMRLFESVGAGTHHLVCSIPQAVTPLVAVLHALGDDHGAVHLAESDALVFCTVLAAGLATGAPGGLVLRTTAGPGRTRDRVRGWVLRDAWLQPLSEAEVFNAYCTDAETGEPVPPEPDVEYSAGTVLPPPKE
jgi:hypothetical protein